MKIIRQTASISIFLALAAGAHAYSLSSTQEESGGPDSVWSKTQWYDTGSQVPMKQKPGPSDFVTLYNNITLDTDITLKDLYMHARGGLRADGKKIKVGKFVMNVVDSTLTLKNSSMEVSRLFDIAKRAGTNTIQGINISLEDSSFSANGLMATIAQTHLNTSSGTGITVDLRGQSRFEIRGTTIVDELFKGPPSTLFIKFRLSERNGKVPQVKLDSTDLKGFQIDISVRSELKKGKYALFLLKDKKPDFSGVKLRFNGRSYNIGDSVEIGEKLKMSVAVEAMGNDGTGLVLTVK